MNFYNLVQNSTPSPVGTSPREGKKHCWRAPGNPKNYENLTSGVLPFLRGDVYRQRGREIQNRYKNKFLIHFLLGGNHEGKGAYDFIR